ncbi:mannose-specific lectin-like [Typha angustifolia]|uniref:mannose-specific lectin-like n=1 Tax=Typha angustifolia TaxID=59011 RepID=UPI003C2F9717
MATITTPLSLSSLLILTAILALLAPACSADNILYSGSSLYAGQSLTEGNYRFTMQTDCNLVLYDYGNPIWASQTSGRGSGCRLDMQRDGNLVVYDASNNARWASGTNRGNGNYVLVLQRDRNVVIYGGALWSTGTNIRGTVDVVISKNSTAPIVDVDAVAEVNNRKIAMVA